MREPGWVVVPVKRLAQAKTRLRGVSAVGLLEGPQKASAFRPGRQPAHDQLVLAMAQDTVRAALACPLVAAVLVVTDDPDVHATLGGLGARVVPDAPGAGLNAAIAYGAATVARPGRWVSALAADLPALRPEELAGALRVAAAQQCRGFVPDASGAGTTLLATPPGVAIDPRFGLGSAALHAVSGARRLDGDWPSLRRDVDTAADLSDAAGLGLGPHTAAVYRVGSWRAGDNQTVATIAAGKSATQPSGDSPVIR